jgi:hypothetical protein
VTTALTKVKPAFVSKLHLIAPYYPVILKYESNIAVDYVLFCYPEVLNLKLALGLVYLKAEMSYFCY